MSDRRDLGTCVLTLCFASLAAACSPGGMRASNEGAVIDGSVADAHVVGDASTTDNGTLQFDAPTPTDAVADLGEAGINCGADSLDMNGCPCGAEGSTRACFTGAAANRGVGACRDGQQTCVAVGEFPVWSKCSGDTLPVKEPCTDEIDHDCNHLISCLDPSCSWAPVCNTACTDGATRDCYDGPAGTVGVGICRAGKQTCTGGVWGAACVGETLPTAEVCADALDHNCNHAPGCLDLFVCILDPACQEKCPTTLDPGCVCAQGSGDTATCPSGMHGVSGGGLVSPTLECCPCQVKDCGDANCCGETICAGSSWCSSLTCRDLPASCEGKVNADCDDFPEDCDEPCCKCYGDCSGS